MFYFFVYVFSFNNFEGLYCFNYLLYITEVMLWLRVTSKIVPIDSSLWAFVAQIVKNLPAMPETQVQSLGWKEGNGEGNGFSL